jgi:hypothetical protein
MEGNQGRKSRKEGIWSIFNKVSASEGRREGGKDGRMEGWKDGRTDGWMDGWMEGWKV